MAALTVADTGLGATISGTSLITTQVVSIGEMTISVDSLDISSLDTTGFEALRPSDLRKNPEVEVGIIVAAKGIAAPSQLKTTSTSGFLRRSEGRSASNPVVSRLEISSESTLIVISPMETT